MLEQALQPKAGPKADLQFINEIRQAQTEAAKGLVVPYEFGSASKEDSIRDCAAPVGREFGSPDLVLKLPQSPALRQFHCTNILQIPANWHELNSPTPMLAPRSGCPLDPSK